MWTAAPALARTPFTAAYLAAVVTALNRPPDADTATEAQPNPDDLMRLAAHQATSTQRASGTARLRRAAARHPHASDTLNHLADVLQTARVNDDVAPDADHPAERP